MSKQMGLQTGPLLVTAFRHNDPLSTTTSDKKPKNFLPITAAQSITQTVSVEVKTASSASKPPSSSMKICVLQSSYEGANSPLESHDDCPDPSLFTAQHEFHHRYLLKATAAAQIDAAIAEGFDLFFNFMWGQPEDAVAGVDAIRYLESRNIPFVGINSTTVTRSKLDFYSAARAAGLTVPATGSDMKFPVFVKPAKMYASMFIDEHSVCRNQAELDLQLQRINECLAPRRKEAENGNSNGVHSISNSDGSIGSHNITRNKSTPYVNGNVHDHDDIVVQEYIPGRDYSVMVVEMGNTPVAQNPTRFRFPQESTKNGTDFFTFDIKVHPKTEQELLVRSENPDLFDRLRELAVQAWHVNEMQGSNWCNVDFRERGSDGELFLLEVNPMPPIFYRWENEWEDAMIRESFPGGHRAFVNAVITTKLLHVGKHKAAIVPVAASFDAFADAYDASQLENSQLPQLTDSLIAAYDFTGSILDLGCGTSLFGRKLYDHQKQHGISPSTAIGNDLSQGMVDKNPNPASYKEFRVGPLQNVIMDVTEPFDHIISITTLQYLDEVTLSAVMARMFQVAQKSVTFTIDEIPESYNVALEKRGLPFMRVWNHVAQVDGFGVPRGWRMASRQRRYGWTSPRTGDVVYLTIFRFEALKALDH